MEKRKICFANFNISLTDPEENYISGNLKEH